MRQFLMKLGDPAEWPWIKSLSIGGVGAVEATNSWAAKGSVDPSGVEVFLAGPWLGAIATACAIVLGIINIATALHRWRFDPDRLERKRKRREAIAAYDEHFRDDE
jgi:hypothetical protein